MVLNYIWIGFILIAFVVACCKLIFANDTRIAAPWDEDCGGTQAIPTDHDAK